MPLIFSISILVTWLVYLGIAQYNRQHALHLENISFPEQTPFISIMIPARNEAQNIASCIDRIYQSAYPTFEVLVLDDHSSDATPEILAQLKATYPSLQVYVGQDLPDGWSGKAWACYQLAQEAEGEYFIFLDADVQIEPNAIVRTVAALESGQQMVTAFPHQKYPNHFVGAIVSHIMHLSIFLTSIVSRIGKKGRAIANGQWLAWNRQTYWEIGGHKTVANSVLDDMEFAKILSNTQHSWQGYVASQDISVSMYHSITEAVHGFGKNLFAMFGYHLLAFLLGVSVFIMTYFGPVLAVCIGLAIQSETVLIISTLSLCIQILAIASVHASMRNSPILTTLYLPGAIAVLLIALYSLLQGQQVTWKGRLLKTGAQSQSCT